MSTPLKDFRLGVTESIDRALAASAAAFGQDKSTYRCTYCHAWHVGSGIVPKRKRSAIAKRGRT